MTVNARVNPDGGELEVRLLDETGKPLRGFDWDDCLRIRGGRVDHLVTWKSKARPPEGKAVRFEFRFQNAAVYSLDIS